jgi:hypothetical protein
MLPILHSRESSQMLRLLRPSFDLQVQAPQMPTLFLTDYAINLLVIDQRHVNVETALQQQPKGNKFLPLTERSGVAVTHGMGRA